VVLIILLERFLEEIIREGWFNPLQFTATDKDLDFKKELTRRNQIRRDMFTYRTR